MKQKGESEQKKIVIINQSSSHNKSWSGEGLGSGREELAGEGPARRPGPVNGCGVEEEGKDEETGDEAGSAPW